MPAPGAQWTYQANTQEARHNWLHLTPAYAADLVSTLLKTENPAECIVLDPFLGSGTTAIRAAQLGFRSIGWDINPFLLELAQAKATVLSSAIASDLLELGNRCAAAVKILHDAEMSDELCAEPTMHNLERWWPSAQRLQLRQLKTAIQLHNDDPIKLRLLRCAFAAAVKGTAQVHHQHHSLSFTHAQAADQEFPVNAVAEYFLGALQHFVADCQTPIRQTPRFLQNDARQAQGSEFCNLVICSPPYPNRMSYMRELRPYLYWLDYLHLAHECADMDWLAIGGTWGTATNRLKTWTTPEQRHLTPALLNCISALPDQGSSALIKQYLIRYSHDMLQHFLALRFVLEADAALHYIVGNANYYGVPFPSDQLFCELLSVCGYRNISSRILRRRSSSKQLFEYDVSALAPITCCH